ncbi:related to LysR family regulatory protein [Phialocephala subalpina]|uniref:Related to LysR family regulatory protein n=1 Tax=Phialocephala subalpina TaxID=576137 RepID=A0A1L7WED7_9HELO|nr:related to LysR family regulatory protein [Phialocephala subalpina]
MLGIWGAAPARVPTDTIVPVHFFDDTPLWRAFVLYSMFVFDDVLDAEKLRDSLDTLARRDGWRKLGARMRRNAKGELEYHVPAAFTNGRPALAYSHVHHDMDTTDHPIASRLPKPSTRPSIVGDPDEFRSLFQPERGPVKLDDYLNTDRPQLGLHIVSFKDKTIICLYWPHTLMDAMGKMALLDAWMLMLQGRAEDIVSPQGGATDDVDPLAELGKHPTEPHKLAGQRLSMFGLAQYGVSNIMDFCRTQENRMVCVPASFVTKLRETALKEIADDSEKPPFLSEGDILCAWWTRVAISHLPQDSQRTIVLNNAYSLRAPLAADLLPSSSVYVSNAIGFINVLLPAHEVFSKPLSYVASAIRHSIKELGTRTQVEAFTAMWRESQGKLPPFFGDRGMHMITFSNWSKARLFETDFSAAVIKPGKKSRGPGVPSYIQNNQFGLILPNGFPIIGKDADGNYWLSGYMNKGHWGRIEEQLAGDSRE